MQIKTNHFQKRVSEGLQNVRSSGDFCDVTLVSEDKARIDAHKVILATASTVFKNMFNRLNHTHPMIFLRGVTANQLNCLIQLIYFGETIVNEDQSEGVLQLVEEFKVNGEMETNRKETKTKSLLCNFYNRGFCKEGNSCLFNHPKDDCKDHLHGRCQDPWCKNRHRSICKHWLRGSCSNKQECEFLHVRRMDDSNNRQSSRSRNNSTRSYSSSSGDETG